MASSAPILRPLSCCKLILQTPKPRHFIRRPLSTVTSSYRTPPPPPPRLPPGVTSTSIIGTSHPSFRVIVSPSSLRSLLAPKSIKTYPPPAPTALPPSSPSKPPNSSPSTPPPPALAFSPAQTPMPPKSATSCSCAFAPATLSRAYA